jgi:hypothetical protein
MGVFRCSVCGDPTAFQSFNPMATVHKCPGRPGLQWDDSLISASDRRDRQVQRDLTPENRSDLEIIVHAGNEVAGAGTHWIVEREA